MKIFLENGDAQITCPTDSNLIPYQLELSGYMTTIRPEQKIPVSILFYGANESNAEYSPGDLLEITEEDRQISEAYLEQNGGIYPNGEEKTTLNKKTAFLEKATVLTEIVPGPDKSLVQTLNTFYLFDEEDRRLNVFAINGVLIFENRSMHTISGEGYNSWMRGILSSIRQDHESMVSKTLDYVSAWVEQT